MKFRIGEKVLLGRNEIGTIVKPEHNNCPDDWIWVFSPAKGYPSGYAPHNVKKIDSEHKELLLDCRLVLDDVLKSNGRNLVLQDYGRLNSVLERLVDALNEQ